MWHWTQLSRLQRFVLPMNKTLKIRRKRKMFANQVRCINVYYLTQALLWLLPLTRLHFRKSYETTKNWCNCEVHKEIVVVKSGHRKVLNLNLTIQNVIIITISIVCVYVYIIQLESLKIFLNNVHLILLTPKSRGRFDT